MKDPHDTRTIDLAEEAAEGRRRRDAGIARVSASTPAMEWILACRTEARIICNLYGRVSANEVFLRVPRPYEVHPNAAGAVFKTKEFALVEHTARNSASAHARRVGVYRLRD